MAKLTDFTTPTGQKGNILQPSSWLPLITGAMMFLLTFSLGQWIFNGFIKPKSPAGGIDPIVDRPQAVNNPVGEVY